MRDGGEMVTAPPLARLYAGFVRRRVVLLVALAVALAASFLVDIATGPASLPLRDVVAGLLDRAALPRAQGVILWDVRLPYAAMAVFVGAALGLAGAEMQTVLNNPLASPMTLGVSFAATFGASVAIVLELDLFGLGANVAIAASAFAGAAGATLLIYALSRSVGATRDTVVLFGIAMFFTFNALVSLIQFVANTDALQQIVFWTMGSLARATWGKIDVIAAVLVLCVPLSLRHAWALTALRGGEEQARSFGIPVERLRLAVLLRASLLAAVAVAFAGAIGFIGLVGPHIARLLLGEDHRFYLPGSALAGAVVLSAASIASKLLIPGLIVPIGIVTALVGIPLFMALVLGQRRAS